MKSHSLAVVPLLHFTKTRFLKSTCDKSMIFNRYQNKKERALLFTTSFILPKSRTAGYQHFPNLQTITRWIEHHTFALKFAMKLNLIKHFRIDFIEFNRQSLSISTTRNGFIVRSIEVRFFFRRGEGVPHWKLRRVKINSVLKVQINFQWKMITGRKFAHLNCCDFINDYINDECSSFFLST